MMAPVDRVVRIQTSPIETTDESPRQAAHRDTLLLKPISGGRGPGGAGRFIISQASWTKKER